VAVISYLEHDHPDCYPTPQEYYQAFVAFSRRLKAGGLLLLSYDQPGARGLAADAPENALVLTYGLDPNADYTAEDLHPNQRGGYDYTACWRQAESEKVTLAQVSLQVPGEHNVRNSLAALAVIHLLLADGRLAPSGETAEVLRQAACELGEFSGTGRRFDVQGEVNTITVIDDYAHHPTEIQATLAAARARYPERRIWAVWQPHTFSRTRTLLAEFARSFSAADQVIVTEVYAAREKAADFDNFSAAQVVAAMQHPAAQYISGLQDVSDYLLELLRPGDVLLVLSAGDADQVSAAVLAGLREREDRHG